MDEELKAIVRKFALDNARKYEGVPNIGAVIGKVLGVRPELKAQLGTLSKDIKAVCDEVQKLSVDEQTQELEQTAPELLAKRGPEEKKLKPLKNAQKGKVVMRLAPSPSGVMHIGHGIVFALSHLYCKEYDGKLILRIEDTNPEEIYEPAYEMTPRDLNWLTENRIHEVVLQSSRLEKYYNYANHLVEKGAAYVCTCNPDVFRALSAKQKACPCRDLETTEQLSRWDRMFIEFEPGEAVLRIKTNINDPNPAMRDWPAMRINHHPHPKTGDKYKVWPLMNFAVAVDDHELGVTHTVRGKDHVDNAKRQQHIYDFFGWQAPEHAYIGRIKFEGLELSKRKIKLAIEHGKYNDWDDIRLATLAALKRRGFQPGAFRDFAMDMGLGLNDKVVPVDDFFKSLEAHNRAILDPIASRYFFVWDPIKIAIKGAPKQTVKSLLHPDDEKRSYRIFETHEDFYVSTSDYESLKSGKLYRLKDCLNFKTNGECEFDSIEYDVFRKNGKDTLHWLPAGKHIAVEVLMPDNTPLKGLGESALGSLDVGTIVQFERFGFCRLDKKSKDKLVFWFTHK